MKCIRLTALICLFVSPFVLVTATSRGADDEDEIKALAKDLKHKDAKVRAKAAAELGKRGPTAAIASRELCDAITDPNTTVSLAAFNALETVKPELYKPIAKIVLDKTNAKKVEGVTELGNLGGEAKPAAYYLAHVLTRLAAEDGAKIKGKEFGFGTTQGATYQALRQIGSDDPEVIKLFKSLAGPGTKSTAHRYKAAELLIEWAGTEETRRKELLPFIRSGLETPGLEIAYINLAATYGELSKDFLPVLKRYKLSNSAPVRDAATKAVDTIEAAIK